MEGAPSEELLQLASLQRDFLLLGRLRLSVRCLFWDFCGSSGLPLNLLNEYLNMGASIPPEAHLCGSSGKPGKCKQALQL